MKHLAPFYARKQLTECLVLSRIGYNDVLLHQVPNYFINRLQRVHRQICRLVRYLEIGLAACQTYHELEPMQTRLQGAEL